MVKGFQNLLQAQTCNADRERAQNIFRFFMNHYYFSYLCHFLPFWKNENCALFIWPIKNIKFKNIKCLFISNDCVDNFALNWKRIPSGSQVFIRYNIKGWKDDLCWISIFFSAKKNESCIRFLKKGWKNVRIDVQSHGWSKLKTIQPKGL